MTIKEVLTMATILGTIIFAAGVLFNKVDNLENIVVTKPGLKAAVYESQLAMTKEMAKEHKEIRQKIARYHRGGE